MKCRNRKDVLKDKLEELKNDRDFLISKYGEAYKLALAKLNAQVELGIDAYDKTGILRPEFILTRLEADAMLYCPESASTLTLGLHYK